VWLTALRLTDFRSYARAELALRPGATLFLGPNGQGKTNLIEAVHYLACLGSHRVAGDQPLVRAGAASAVVSARVAAGGDDRRRLAVDLEINLGRPNKARLNQAPVRPRDVVGALRVVLFAPEDLVLAQGEPAARRAFIDALITSRWPRLAGVRADYDRALRQRTALLKALSGRGPKAVPGWDETLEVWDERLVGLGAEITAARLNTVAALRDRFAARYAAIAPARDPAGLAYASHVALGTEPAEAGQSGPDRVESGRVESGRSGSGPVESDRVGPIRPAAGAAPVIAQLYRAAIARRRQDEIARGQSLVGPHRDDLALDLGGLPVRGYASHGEAWSVALALRLASFDLLRADGLEPVLLLDDVFAQLDDQRRHRLGEVVAGAEQVLITAAVAADVPPGLAGAVVEVEHGALTPLAGPPPSAASAPVPGDRPGRQSDGPSGLPGGAPSAVG
jgi:DNA replication and repair protein RecF